MRGLTLKGLGGKGLGGKGLGGKGLFSRGATDPPKQLGTGPRIGHRTLLLSSLAATLLGALLWYFYLYTPTSLRITELEVSVQGLEGEINLGRAARADLPALRAAVAELERERDIFLSQLPEQNDVAELLDQLRSAAGAAGVVFSALQNTGPTGEAAEGVRLLGFSLATQGTYRQTIGFLQTLEALPRFTKVRRVGLVAGETADDPLLSASYDFTVYVYTGLTPEPAADGTGELPAEIPVETPAETGETVP